MALGGNPLLEGNLNNDWCVRRPYHFSLGKVLTWKYGHLEFQHRFLSVFFFFFFWLSSWLFFGSTVFCWISFLGSGFSLAYAYDWSQLWVWFVMHPSFNPRQSWAIFYLDSLYCTLLTQKDIPTIHCFRRTNSARTISKFNLIFMLYRIHKPLTNNKRNP